MPISSVSENFKLIETKIDGLLALGKVDEAIQTLATDQLFKLELSNTRIATQIAKDSKFKYISHLENLHCFQDLPPIIKKIIDSQLAQGDFIGAVKSASCILNLNNFTVIGEQLEKAELKQETLLQLEKSVESLLPPYRKAILKALIPNYEKLGNKEEVSRLEKIISKLKDFKVYKTTIPDFFTDVFANRFHLTFQVALGAMTALCARGTVGTTLAVAIPAALAVQFPEGRKLENLTGMGAGIVAAGAGFGALPAVAIGTSAAILSRIPKIQTVAKQAKDQAAAASMKCAETLVGLSEQGFDKLKQGIAGLGKIIVNINNLAEQGFDKLDQGIAGLGKAVSKVDSAFNYAVKYIS